MAIPAALYLWPVTRSGPIKVREEVGDDASWETWTGRKVSVANKAVLVIKTDKGYVAYSAVCTHLGCLVEFDSAARDIKCPCHAAAFGLKGEVLRGPPPSALSAYQVSVAQGRVYVSN